ncbi:DeoR/GlpR family DNA-binding transcription regulator [Azospirillum picis]|uniref:DeoR family deoxyribose operon repressor n=1 Tax=Azospirillum picis TaxID=488438 RepID=A0ABU0MS11_9PROT|nr:DeoR/GlpR family DNA-binding transcription regulator [Azospirillum picis]MBP2302612.1 DeoR family deoxyribose operon repressor [Azospirillum picis]MDQ0536273.1 DeoR family deoxyribose operon repressor [Azospirillum picis]
MSMRRAERLNRLQSALDAGGYLRLKDAARLLGVSEMTVRRDMASCGGRFAYLGGYIAGGVESASGMGYLLDREQDAHIEMKRAAGEAAATLVKPGETVFIDCGTTTTHLASRIPPDSQLTVVCYAMNIAEIVCKKPGVRVVMLGGLYHASSASFSSPESLEMLRGIGINTAFISAGGVHESLGISCSNFHEVEIKQTAIANAVTKALVVDTSKFDQVKPAFFAKLDSFGLLCCDHGLDAARAERLSAGGLRIVTG